MGNQEISVAELCGYNENSVEQSRKHYNNLQKLSSEYSEEQSRKHYNNLQKLSSEYSDRCVEIYVTEVKVPEIPVQVEKQCKKCDKTFFCGRRKDLFCSKYCRTIFLRRKKLEKRLCLKCKKKYQPKKYRQKFCSEICKKEFRNANRLKKKMIKKTCSECKKTYETYSRASDKFCSNECKTISKNKKINQNWLKRKKRSPNKPGTLEKAFRSDFAKKFNGILKRFNAVRG